MSISPGMSSMPIKIIENWPTFDLILARKPIEAGCFDRSQKVSGLKQDEITVRTVDLPYFEIFYGLLYRLCEIPFRSIYFCNRDFAALRDLKIQ